MKTLVEFSCYVFCFTEKSVPLWSCKYVLSQVHFIQVFKGSVPFCLVAKICLFFLLVQHILLLIPKLNVFCIFVTSRLLCAQLLTPSLDTSHSHLFSSLSVTCSCENAPSLSLKNGFLEPNLREKEVSLLRGRFCVNTWTFSFPTLLSHWKGKCQKVSICQIQEEI